MSTSAPHSGKPGLNGSHALARQDPSLARVIPWPKTDRPLRIALLGWARLSSQAREGSGYNLSASELARGLVLAGHTVKYLAAGMTNRLRFLRPGRPFIESRETWGGIECFELRNSPNAAPAAMNFLNMATEISDPGSTALVTAWLRQVGAQVVHIHSQEGYALDLIPAIEAMGIPVVVTPHNYWFACPQVDLLHREREVCIDFEGGQKCVGCLPGRNIKKLRTTRAWGQTLEHMLGMYPADVLRKAVYGIKPALRGLLRGRVSRAHIERQHNPDRLNDPELALGFDAVHREPAKRGTTIDHDPPMDPWDKPKDYLPADYDTNEQVIAHAEQPRPVNVSLNIYGQRRDAGIAALSAASLVTPPSDYLRKVHVAMGVPEERTRWVRLGQPHFDQINRRTRRSPFYNVRPWDPKTATQPLRFAFFGTVRPNKGLEVLARAIPLLDQSIRERCQFIIRAQGYEFGFRKRLAKYPEVSVWCGYDLYQLISSAGEYDVGILSHIWLENSPLVLLENFHAGKMVVCSRLGGPVDWVKDPRQHPTDYNGLLFTGGAEEELAAAITRIASGEVAVPSPSEIHERTTLRSYPDHVRELESIYHEVIARKSGMPATSQPARAPQVHVRPSAANLAASRG
jgi:glycosyltransferase involved in cell wall biosynthesis